MSSFGGLNNDLPLPKNADPLPLGFRVSVSLLFCGQSFAIKLIATRAHIHWANGLKHP
jgi:hypothetical protein